MKAKLLTLFLLISTVSVAQQGVIMKDQDTVIVFPQEGKHSYFLTLKTDLIPEELHSLITKYGDDYRFSFENEKDLITTMSGYIESKASVDWVLSKNEKILLKKFEKIQFRERKNSKIKPSNNMSVGDHLQRAGRYKNASIAVLYGSGTTAYALIAADPINGPTASIIGVAGGLVSLGLNIAGNMELIAAGKAENRP